MSNNQAQDLLNEMVRILRGERDKAIQRIKDETEAVVTTLNQAADSSIGAVRTSTDSSIETARTSLNSSIEATRSGLNSDLEFIRLEINEGVELLNKIVKSLQDWVVDIQQQAKNGQTVVSAPPPGLTELLNEALQPTAPGKTTD